MNYPKQVMTITELKKMGFPEDWLRAIYRSRHQTIAWKMNADKSNSLILFDTEELEKYRKAHCTGV